MRRAIPVLWAVALACGGRGEPTSVRLRFSYEEGDTLTYVYRSSGTAIVPDTSAPEGVVERPYEREMTIEEAVTEVTPRNHFLLALTYHLGRDTLHRKSGLPERVTIQVQITPQGRIIDVSGVETMRPLLGDFDFQSYFEQSQPVFPERALKVGDSWTQEVKVVSPRAEPVVTSSTYVLESLTQERGEPVAVIAFDGDIYLPVTRSAADTAGGTTAPLVFEERIRVRGKIFFAHEAGIVRRVETRSEATFSRISLEGGERVRRDMQLREESAMELVD